MIQPRYHAVVAPWSTDAVNLTSAAAASQRLSVLLPVTTTIVCYVYAGAIDQILQWPWLFPSIVFMDVPAHNTSHVLSSIGLPLTAIAIAAFGVARYTLIHAGCAKSDRIVRRANETSLAALGGATVALVGLVACTITDNPPAHYSFAGILFITLTIDVVAQMGT